MNKTTIVLATVLGGPLAALGIGLETGYLFQALAAMLFVYLMFGMGACAALFLFAWPLIKQAGRCVIYSPEKGLVHSDILNESHQYMIDVTGIPLQPGQTVVINDDWTYTVVINSDMSFLQGREHVC